MELSENIDLDDEIFIDCIFYCNFLQLEIGIPLSMLTSFSILMAIIVHRSHKLSHIINRQHYKTRKRKHISLIISNVFKQKATISYILPPHYTDKSYQFILSIVGKSCPSLCKLKFKMETPTGWG